MMVRDKIAAVSYLNTVPFIYGIEHGSNLSSSLLLSPPSGCASAFSQGLANVALVPVAAVPSLKDAHIITPFCLGTNGVVRSVMLFSNSPIESVTDIHLDSHSLTSVALTKILCRELWQIAPAWHDMQSYQLVDTLAETEAVLLIGDKVFDYEGRFKYAYDLAVCWKRLTNLPFVFAVWVARLGVDQQVVVELENALRFGTQNIHKAINYYGHSGKPYAFEYLTLNMSYDLDTQKQQALELFWQKQAACLVHNFNPG